MKQIIFFFLAMIFLVACQEKKDIPVADVYQIQNLGTLSTTEYTFGKIIHLNDNKEWYKIGDRKILISVKAVVKAGVDLQKIDANDLVVKDKTVEITLPPAEVVSFEMNPNDIRTEMSDVNGFRMEFSQEDKVKILKMGEKKIRQEMLESDMLKEAEKNTRIFLTDFYQDLGFDQVIIEFKTKL